MNERIARLRQLSREAQPAFSAERAKLVTDFYKANDGKYSVPVMRAMNFYHLCDQKRYS